MKLNYQDNSLKPGIYKILNTHTNRTYIGQAKEFKSRWCGHRSSLKLCKHQNKFFLNDFNKCREELGHDDFLEFHVLEVMEGSTKEERNQREEEWIAKFYDNQNLCYNFKQVSKSKSSSLRCKHTNETKQRMSEVQKQVTTDERKVLLRTECEKLWNTPEHRQMMSNALKERWKLPAFRKQVSTKISEANLGREFSEETRHKMAIAKQGRKLSKTTRQRMSEAQKKRRISEKEL